MLKTPRTAILMGLLATIGCQAPAPPPPRPVLPIGSTHASPYEREIDADDPLGLWRLDGDIEEGALAIELDGATRFDGESSTFLSAPDFGGGGVTVEVWLRQVTQGTILSYFSDDTPGTFTLRCTPEGLGIEIHGEPVSTEVPCPADEAWRHLAMRWRSDTGKADLVLHGEVVWEGVVAKGQPLETGGSLVLGQRQGCDKGCLTDGLVGDVDELAVHDTSLRLGRLRSHVRVAQGELEPTPDNRGLPARSQLQTVHAFAVKSAAFSPDGDRLAMGSEDGIIEIRDVATGRLIHALDKHSIGVVELAFSPDGRRLVSAAGDMSVKVWDLDRGSLIHDMDTHRGTPTLLVPNSGRLAYAFDLAEVLRVWDLVEGRLVTDSQANSSIDIPALSPDGQTIVAALGHKTIARLDGPTAKLTATSGFWGESPQGIVFGPDGTWFAGLGGKGNLHLVDTESFKLIRTLKPPAAVQNPSTGTPLLPKPMAVDGTGTQIFSVGVPEGIWRWDLTSNTATALTYEGKFYARSMALSPDGTRLAVAGSDGTSTSNGVPNKVLRLFDTTTGTIIAEHNAISGFGASPLVFSPSGDKLLSSGPDYSGMMLDARTGDIVQRFPARLNKRYQTMYSPSGRRLLTLGGHVHLWDTDTVQSIAVLETKTSLTPSAAFSPDGKWLATRATGTVKLRDPNTGRVIHRWKGHDPKATQVFFTPDSTRLIAVSGDAIRTWDLAAGAPSMSFKDFPGSLLRTGPQAHGNTMVATGQFNAIKVFALDSGELTASIPTTQPHLQTALSHDGAWLATYETKTVQIWRLATAELVHTLDAHRYNIEDVQFTWDNRRLVTIGDDGMVKIWDVATGKRTTESGLHRGAAKAMALSPDGEWMATVGPDRKVLIYSMDGRLKRELETTARIIDVDFSPEAHQIAATTRTGVTHIWNLATFEQVSLVTQGPQWLAFTPDGYFDASPAGASQVAMVQGSRVFGIDQRAMTHNRPDVLMDRLGVTNPYQAQKSLDPWRNPPTQKPGRFAPSKSEVTARVARLELLQDHYRARFQKRLDKANLTARELRLAGDSQPTARVLSEAPDEREGHWAMSLAFKDERGLASYQIYVNDVPVYTQKQPLEGRRAIIDEVIELSGGDNKIEIAATNIHGLESSRALTHAYRQDAPKGTLYFVGFGVSDYLNNDDIPDLGFAHQDVLDLKATFEAAGKDFDAVKVQIYINDKVTPQNIRAAGAIFKDATVHDTVVLFVAGHGVRDLDEARTYYYLTHGARLNDLPGTAVEFETIEELLFAARPRNKLFLMDTCQSGEVDDTLASGLSDTTSGAMAARAVPMATRSAKVFGAEAKPQLDPSWLNRERYIYADLARRSGAIVFSSSRGQEYSLESAEYANGAFTEELLNALQTAEADTDGDGRVSTNELRAYVSEAVPKLTGGRQNPTVDRDNLSQSFTFPIAAPKEAP